MDAGFTAESLCQANSGVGRATVYRTLKLLLDAGVICRLPMPDGAPRYQRALAEHHHHTVCTRCGTVGEFRDSTVERLVRSVGKELGGQIVGHRMEFYVVCSSCLGHRRASPAPARAARAGRPA
jgi:Fur family ferric uptake transcriptional regulator